MEIRHTISPTTKHELETFYFTDSKKYNNQVKVVRFKNVNESDVKVYFSILLSLMRRFNEAKPVQSYERIPQN